MKYKVSPEKAEKRSITWKQRPDRKAELPEGGASDGQATEKGSGIPSYVWDR